MRTKKLTKKFKEKEGGTLSRTETLNYLESKDDRTNPVWRNNGKWIPQQNDDKPLV